ncbi:MAG: nucleotide exchange factor GrpE [Muribaculaceae bacterium]|nr:nucleotide exchange factor GrpE [Muribaculaceae bacterium]
MSKNNNQNQDNINGENNQFESESLREEQGAAAAEKIEEEMGEAMTEAENQPEDEVAALRKQVEELNADVAKEKKEYMFLMAEFDNFRKRTLREKSDLIKNAGENVLKGLLPIVDDFERGLQAAENSSDSQGVKEGMELIYNKLKKYMEQNGVKEMDPADDTFDTERHEAISVIPVPDESKKGKIIDTVTKGYMLNDKVLRHAKVVVGQ